MNVETLIRKRASFNRWLDIFLGEKGIDRDRAIEVEGPSGLNMMTVGTIVAFMKVAPLHEQEDLKKMLVKIDFANGSVLDYFTHLAKAVAR